MRGTKPPDGGQCLTAKQQTHTSALTPDFVLPILSAVPIALSVVGMGASSRPLQAF